ncbi:hypothetical protein [Parvibaculum sp.]|jgi:hypothetical protein|uniref:hypothetical protein n=1 Tax=Parvibaculum sp. TaxID=2024848 RepID=UPI000C5818C9|nr:hypothetical protein [Parvibaculum sp.]MAM94428.1 hypothetical protein [Parvibaculum sp.]HCX68114.1 hypothetical protein [Rhodobiaceae bacterium]|tara:strand:- start:16379 stop:16693 length:315 start_codon:yes stop_codon:yes gene_type:complete
MFSPLIRLIIVSLFCSALSVSSTGAPLYEGTVDELVLTAGMDIGDDLPFDEACEVCHAFQHMTLGSAHYLKLSTASDLAFKPCAILVESLSRSPEGPPPENPIA